MSDKKTPELTDEQAELQRRYGLSAEDVTRVRGDSWAEKCEDAERLANLAEPQSIKERARRHLEAMQQENPNLGELAAFAAVGQKRERQAALARSLHTDGTDEPVATEGTGFDGGVREPAPEPSDPEGAHSALMAELARVKQAGEA